ncbi:hypothetical protein AVEN_218555-1, partial [Araneus ventricosus]
FLDLWSKLARGDYVAFPPDEENGRKTNKTNSLCSDDWEA